MGQKSSKNDSNADVGGSGDFAGGKPVAYGTYGTTKGEDSRRYPFTFHQLEFEPDLLSYLQESPEFTNGEDELDALGFQRHVDHPGVPGHRYYEGYFHCKDTNSAVRSLHPRFGFDIQKPPASIRLRAFIRAFQLANKDWIVKCLAGKDDASEKLQEFEKLGLFFADLAIQIHAGDAVGPKSIGWHCDAPNSILHMALSFRGKRALHTTQFPRIRSSAAEGTRQVRWQDAGDVYVSSPFAVEHGVQYAAAHNWEDRIIAVQARLLLTSDQYVELDEARESWGPMMREVTRLLCHADLHMPSLEHVLYCERELQI